MKNVLVTGGCGFIGSHTTLELLKSDKYNVTIIDNLVNSKLQVIKKIENITNKKVNFVKLDLLNYFELDNLFNCNKFHIVLHFAGLKAVGESIKKPLLYYENNINSTLNLLKIMKKYDCYNLIFSSSATVYGTPESPIKENSQIGINISNPYGKSKYMIELILKDLTISNKNWKIISLRYFNPVGCDKSGLLGEDPNGIPNNLLPYIVKVAIQNNLNKFIDDKYNYLNIFGKDFNTRDGTGIRDYIHVNDLAIGHISAIENLKNGYNVYNLGSGKGYSVLEFITTFEKINNIKIPYKIINRREGDLDKIFCDPKKAKIELGWEVKLNLEDICKDSWKYCLNNFRTE